MNEEMFQKLLDTQSNAFRSAVEILFSSLQDRVQKLEQANTELKVKLEYAESDIKELKKEKKEDKEQIEELKNQLRDMIEDKVDVLVKRVDQQEDYSRRNNVRIDGLKEEVWEKEEVTQDKVVRLLQDKLEMREPKLEVVHRVGQPNFPGGGSPNRPRTIIARFTSIRDRDAALRNAYKLRNTDVYINEDLCAASVQLRKEKLPEMKRARAAGRIAYFRHTRLVTHDRTMVAGSEGAVGGNQEEVTTLSNNSASQNKYTLRKSNKSK